MMNERIVKRRRGIQRVIAGLVALAACGAMATVTLETAVLAETPPSADGLAEDFADPPAKWKSRPLWFWNGPLDKSTTTTIMEKSVAARRSRARTMGPTHRAHRTLPWDKLIRRHQH
jgi:hypothetical protein